MHQGFKNEKAQLRLSLGNSRGSKLLNSFIVHIATEALSFFPLARGLWRWWTNIMKGTQVPRMGHKCPEGHLSDTKGT